MMQSIYDQYGWENVSSFPLTQGLINQTFEISSLQGDFILQNINTQVFKEPYAIDHNINSIGQFYNANRPDQIFTHLVQNLRGETLIERAGKHYRAFKKMEGFALDVLTTASQAKEAAHQFGQFTASLAEFPIGGLKVTIPQFHDLALRYHQFEQALIHGDANRIEKAKEAILFLQSHQSYVKKWLHFTGHQEAHLRVTHHDTKISNVLFKEEAAICVIDLDTTMPGYYISDVGDMCRTYLCPVNESCQDLSQIKVIPERWTAIQNGYLEAMGVFLTTFEKDHFAFSGQCIIYMQALRFLTDYLQLDTYYKVDRPSQNLDRTLNQNQLLIEFNKII
jgi:Ser/Thr protein kinase RdoA (MazF antagonist)